MTPSLALILAVQFLILSEVTEGLMSGLWGMAWIVCTVRALYLHYEDE